MCFVSDRKPYNSDLSDAQWDLIRPVIAGWKAAHPSVSGHAGRYEMREILNAIRYVARNGDPVGGDAARPATEVGGVLLLRGLA
ncbi:hypothetical protein GCM10009839_17600 [Catenulispora yoronensis]|uniref:Insertion element IS402-like domain-containing protein n=1 Tax=Catenulispora yoronensis TaxID=450799 RepID=A0ABN2TV01_9ACTN